MLLHLFQIVELVQRLRGLALAEHGLSALINTRRQVGARELAEELLRL